MAGEYACVILHILKTTLKLIEKFEFNTETISDNINGNDRIESILSQGANATSSQLTLSDQLYCQAKIDEENGRLKKKIEN
ncbi:unnamed protein product [Rotaria sordida]|uniref:Uncharacterized protein n=1 Tax=Rotaria sordida TaxID=392033 RepID=A0A815MXZ7_9BILA|nr:unnamed protein product [Rotaria sordida]CAF3995091.1 unnamed protein product [Rotaria sordida]CAF4043010.1 unnamed protein product [Rotaria sordida]